MTELDANIRDKAYILLDGALFDAPRFIYERDDQPELEYLFLGTPHEAALEVTPCLVKPSRASRLWRAQPEWRDKAVVLVADESLPVIAGHLRSLLSVQLPDGGYSYLRYYSPKQFQRLMLAFTEQERNRFSGPVRDWLAFQADGAWSRFSSDAPQPVKTASDEGWFLLSEQHLAAISGGARSEFIEKLGRFLAMDDQVRLNRLIEEANSLGFRTEKEVSRYAELAFVHGDQITHPESQTILSNREMSAGARLKALDKHLAYGVA
ncbi:DUF4123 domain-containing protein [Marinobacter adhaerens]|jgi:hypothetical protein|uniref:DUF4123 domain-containing protein n=1 Tax=Marinobacter adhaerens TaxID=1033846 RepID=UPI001E59802A|nr:DUF4123 domain-containing protein [Marinobacter adhaerens]MCD1648732.1 DUF4123 domain-containing protein [Marinobacter adhaerens]